MFQSIRNKVLSGSARSVNAKKNIIASFLNKGVAIIITLLLVPVTIEYLNAEQYGIWLTLSSIVAWISYFDVGLGHGFRNRFAEAKANGDTELARKYVTTSYVTLAMIFGGVLIISEIVNPLINWASILNVATSNDLLRNVVSILIIGICVNFILNVATIMLSADQKPAFSAMITTLSQGIALVVIYLLTLYTESNMNYIAIALSWIPCFVVLIVSLFLFTGKYKSYAPSLRYLDLGLIKNIIGLGGKFFVIQISMVLIFQVVNIILSRTLGPESVTLYNVTYKYFSISMMVFNIILSPYWSAFTDAYTRGEYDWMIDIHKKLLRVWYALVLLSLLMLIVSPVVYDFWLHQSVDIPFTVSVAMCVYIVVMSFSTMYMIMLNGIGKVFLQMCTYISCAIVSIPLCSILCDSIGIAGVLVVLSSVYAIQGVLARIQLKKVLDGSATGCWDR